MFRHILLLSSMFLISACGGGGGGESTAADPGPGQAQPTRAVITLATQGALPDVTGIAGIGITVILPPGVSVATDDTGSVASDVITGSGQTASTALVTVASLVPSTTSAAGSLRMVLASTETSGFRVGEFARVTCVISAGSTPKATDFRVDGADFRAIDLRGGTITGLWPALTAQIQ